MTNPRLSFLLLAICAISASAQVISSETQRVLVDVAVTDKKGEEYIRDLKPEEFRVWEDGKEQKILTVSREQEAPRHHYTVLLIDQVSMNQRELLWAREVAGHFVDTNAGENHSMAVVHFGGGMRVTQTFTIDVRRIKTALSQQGVSAVTLQDGGAGPNAQGRFLARDLLRDLRTLSENLEALPGRKSVLFFSAGFAVDSDNSRGLDQAIEAANRSNVAMYPINTRVVALTPAQGIPDSPGGRMARGRGNISGVQLRGPQSDSGDPSAGSASQAAAAALGVMVKLGEGTGGFVVRQPDETETLNRIGEEQREYYVLAYRPPEGSQGSCHKLRVRVERKDTRFRARQEYCNVTRGDLLSGNPVERQLEQRASTEAAGNLQTRLQAPFFYTGANRARVAVFMDIDASQVEFKREKGRYLASFDILGVATRADGSTGARFSDTVKLDLGDQKEVDAFKQAPYRYTTQFNAATGDYKLVVVIGSGAANFGRVEAPLRIEPYQPDQLAISSLALSTTFRAAAASLGGLDSLLMDDSKKFIVNNVEAEPAASTTVDGQVQTAFYAEVYAPQARSADGTISVAAMQIRVFGADTEALAFDSGLLRLDAPASGTAIPVLQLVPVETLKPGRYTLDVQAIDGAQRMAQRKLAFEVK